MRDSNNKSVSVIGNGNVAHSLIPSIISAGYTIDYVAGRNTDKLKAIANQHNLSHTTDYSKLSSNIIIISVSDNAIESIVKELKTKPNQLVLHTAGSVALETIKQHHSHCGILYPLQTFSKKRILSFRSVPICIESSDEKALEIISNLANKLSDYVTYLSSQERLSVHTAAVFVSNFSNLMYTYGAKILTNHGIDFNILRPLIQETAQKVMILPPVQAQTGPALRRDTKTIELHQNQLVGKMKDVYLTLTQWIQEQFPST